jgi:hypothetical protein
MEFLDVGQFLETFNDGDMITTNVPKIKHFVTGLTDGNFSKHVITVLKALGAQIIPLSLI